MTTVNFNPGQSAFHGYLAYARFLDCLKIAVEVVVEVLNYPDGQGTEVAVRNGDGQVLSDCIVYIDGNPLGLKEGKPKSYIPTAGGASAAPTEALVAAAAGAVTGFSFGVHDGSGNFVPQFSVESLDPLSADDFMSILTDYSTGYPRLVALLDDNTTVNGSALTDRIEVGAGDDVIRARGGDDVAFKWSPGDLKYFGGDGRDTLYFTPDGQATPPAFTQAMTLNLDTGRGETAYGDRIVLKSIEVIRTAGSDDHITGSKAIDQIHDVHGGLDVFRTKGGDDLVTLFAEYQATLYDGGKGSDQLMIATHGFGNWTPEKGFGVQRLNLGDASKNLEDFAGFRVVNVENVQVSMTRDYVNMFLIGTGVAETLQVDNYYARHGTVVIKGNGGGDTLTGGHGTDRLLGGDGRDTLIGRDGADVMVGGKAADILNGGAGDDRLTGNKGGDSFVFADIYGETFGHDSVTDFHIGSDHLDFSGLSGVSRFRDLTITDIVGGARIDDGLGGLVDLIGIDADDLSRDDFLF